MDAIRVALAEQFMKGPGGYREQKNHSGKEKKWRYIRRFLCILLFFLCSVVLVRRGINVFLAKQAEGKLQTASSYEKIYQSFERVEMNQLHLRRKWENHRGINLSLEVGGNNLSTLMSCGSAAMSVMGAVNEITGQGGYGIGQYRQYMNEASDIEAIDSAGKEEMISEETAEEGTVAEPDQMVVQGEYIYALWLQGEDAGWIEPALVVYHAMNGTLEQVFQSKWKMSGSNSYEAEMMISGSYLYLAMNRDYYSEDCICYIYDITDPAKPKRTDQLTQDGEYFDMMISGRYFYFISQYQDFTAYDKRDVDRYIPMVREEKIPPEDIYMQRDLYGTGYVVISAYRITDSGKLEQADAKAVAGTAEVIQISKDCIYICSRVVPKNSDRTDRTGITILSYQGGKVTGRKHLIVAGSIDATRETEVNDAHLLLPMRIQNYRGSFVEIEDWILPGWESVPLKIQMQEEADSVERKNICLDETGKQVPANEVRSPKERIRELGFVGQLFAVDENHYIGVGHLGEEKNLKLVQFVVSDEDEAQLLASVAVREYYSPVTKDDRMIYLDRNRSFIGFCAMGSKGTFYYLYHFEQKTDTDVWEFQELYQENFGMKGRAFWIRGTVFPGEKNMMYMIRSSNLRIDGMARRFAVD